MAAERPACTGTNFVGMAPVPCLRPAVALFRSPGDDESGADDHALCWECMLRQLRLAVELRTEVLSIVSMPLEELHLPEPDPADIVTGEVLPP